MDKHASCLRRQDEGSPAIRSLREALGEGSLRSIVNTHERALSEEIGTYEVLIITANARATDTSIFLKQLEEFRLEFQNGIAYFDDGVEVAEQLRRAGVQTCKQMLTGFINDLVAGLPGVKIGVTAPDRPARLM